MNSTHAQTPSSPKPVLLIRVTNHFDLLWRRCRHRKYEFKGRRFAAAADIEDAVITDSLAFARRDRRYRFSIESTAVAREYLRRHPERLAEMRRLVARGRLHISGAGDNIVDGNMLLGESLVRNFVTGYLWNEKQFGLKTVLATRADAFGNCAQLPQILRGCGVRWVEGIGYSPVVGEYWRGLDGSTVFTGHPAVVEVGRGGGFDNIPPCPACAGTGCRTCRGLGIDRERKVRLNPELDRARLATAGRGLYRVQAEELLPNPELLKLATRWAEAYDVRFVNSVDFLDEVQTKLARVDDPPPASVHPACELNPNNTGCYVSRIKIKQTARRLEYALLGAEALCSVASLAGANYPAARLAELWEGVLLILFHDAITGTHTDPAYTELRELQERLETDLQTTVGQVATALAGGGTVPEPAGDWITVFNPTGAPMTTVVERATAHEGLHDEDGRPVPLALTGPTRQGLRSVCFVAEQVPPLGVRRYRFAPGPALEAAENRPLPEAGTVSISNQYFEITADRQGLVAITDRRTGHLVAAPNGLWRPNEAVFERDEGSPWTTLDPNRPRTGLAAHTTLVAMEVTALFQRLRFQCDIPNALDLWGGRIESTVTLVAGVNRVEFHTRVRWGNFNRRLRIAMPVPFTGHAVYGVPYGQQKRERYQPSFGPWAAATGDWPAVDWPEWKAPRPPWPCSPRVCPPSRSAPRATARRSSCPCSAVRPSPPICTSPGTWS